MTYKNNTEVHNNLISIMNRTKTDGTGKINLTDCLHGDENLVDY